MTVSSGPTLSPSIAALALNVTRPLSISSSALRLEQTPADARYLLILTFLFGAGLLIFFFWIEFESAGVYAESLS